MKIFLLVILVVTGFIQQIAQAQIKPMAPGLEYYGGDHSEAEFHIVGLLHIVQKTPPQEKQIDASLRQQLRFMLGLMRSREEHAAALYPKWDYHVLEVTPFAKGVYAVKYLLKAKGVFAKNVKHFTFTLPYNPKTIFEDSKGLCMEKEAVESNFWYHWEPLKEGCPLVENQHYFNYTTEITPIANTTQTYPEYERLVDQNKTIKMTLFFGFEHYDYAKWFPEGTDDWGIIGFNEQRKFLSNAGFQERVWSTDEVAKIYQAKDGFVPYVSEFNLSGKNANIRVRLVLAETGINHNSKAFHTFLNEALRDESVVVYNGHSGIGQNLDLGRIEKERGIKFKMNPNYQILFLGSCVPYAYYTDMFFNRKKAENDINGTLNLDILSYGKESTFANKEDHALTEALVKWATKGKKQSYQDIINSSPYYFFGVNGDEDNPTEN